MSLIVRGFEVRGVAQIAIFRLDNPLIFLIKHSNRGEVSGLVGVVMFCLALKKKKKKIQTVYMGHQTSLDWKSIAVQAALSEYISSEESFAFLDRQGRQNSAYQKSDHMRAISRVRITQWPSGEPYLFFFFTVCTTTFQFS